MRVSRLSALALLSVALLLASCLDSASADANPHVRNLKDKMADKSPALDQWRALLGPKKPPRAHHKKASHPKSAEAMSPFGDDDLSAAASKVNAHDMELIDRILKDEQPGERRMPPSSEPERDESKEQDIITEPMPKPSDPHYFKRFRFIGNTSCADECPGEGHIVEQLKLHKPTPKCCVDLIYETVTYIHKLLTSNKITYWTMKGTLLGVMREKGVVMHDYDIDLGMLFEDINKVAKLRQKIWDDGFVMFQAPWDRYNNMQFVIAKRTKAINKYFNKNPVPEGGIPKFTKTVRELAISGELMAFKREKGHLIQIICTAMGKNDPSQYELKASPDLHSEFKKDQLEFTRRGKTVDGWAKYADQNDKPWANYAEKFGPDNVSPYCQRTAPASFRYEAIAQDVLPVKQGNYYETFLNIPHKPKKILVNYFGKDWATPKRRYG